MNLRNLSTSFASDPKKCIIASSKETFAIVGGYYTVVKVLGLFFTGITKWIEDLNIWWPLSLLFITILYSIFKNIPRLTRKVKLPQKDVYIELAVGNMLDFNGDKIITINTSFMTDWAYIAHDSLQGQVTLKYYQDPTILKNEIINELRNVTPVSNKSVKGINLPVYQVGTMAISKFGEARENNIYWLGFTNFNSDGNVSCTFSELQSALGELWSSIISKGDNKIINIPIIGTGRGRIKAQKSEILIEIIKSFIAACNETKFTPLLRIVIQRSDIEDKFINFEEVSKYLDLITLDYTHQGAGINIGTGKN